MKMNQAIQEFVNSAIESGYVSKEDRSYLLNRVLYLVGEESFEACKEINQPSLLEAMANVVEASVEAGAQAAAAIGKLTSHNVMPRPIPSVGDIVSVHDIDN